jgi:hypothetical protein
MSEPLDREDGPSRWGRFMEDVRTSASVHTPLEVRGTLTRLAGLVLEAVGLKVPVGSQCLIGHGKKHLVPSYQPAVAAASPAAPARPRRGSLLTPHTGLPPRPGTAPRRKPR